MAYELLITCIMSAMEKNTNQLFRRKYFIDSQSVIRYRPPTTMTHQKSSSCIISKNAARVSPIKVPMNGKPPPADAQIAVQLERDGTELHGIRITCPCGRHAEIDIPSSDTAAKPDSGAA